MKVEIRSDNTAIIEGYVNAVERLSRPLKDCLLYTSDAADEL